MGSGAVIAPKRWRLSTPDPARDGVNWLVYCAANPVGHWDPTGLESKLLSWVKGLFSADESEEIGQTEQTQSSSSSSLATPTGANTQVITKGSDKSPWPQWARTADEWLTKFLCRNLMGMGPGDYAKTMEGRIIPMSESGVEFAYSERKFDLASFLTTALIGEKKLIEKSIKSVSTDLFLQQQSKSNTLYGPMNKGPLPDSIANTFRSATYREITTSSEQVLYRVYGGDAAKFGGFWTRTEPTGPLQAQLDLALNPEWGNTANNVVRIKVPVGYTYYEGFAAEQGGYLLGGANQVYIPNVDPGWEF